MESEYLSSNLLARISILKLDEKLFFNCWKIYIVALSP